MKHGSSVRLLIIARTWHGTGGMQRYARDLSEQIGTVPDISVRTIHPARGGVRAVPRFILCVWREVRALQGAGQGRIHACDAAMAGFVAWLCRRYHLPFTVSAHGLDVIYASMLYQQMLRFGLRRAERVCCVSRATAAAVRERGVPGDRIPVVPCGTAEAPLLARRRRDGDAPILLLLGRLVRRKGVAWFIETVLPQLRVRFPDIRVIIAGEGGEREEIERVIRRGGHGATVELRGAVSDAERDALLAQTDVFVLPVIPVQNDMEGFGIVCIEAAMRGVAVAAARSGGIEDAVIEGETGLLFPPGDSAACARVIADMLQRPFDPAAVQHGARTRYGWPVLLPRYRDAIVG